MADQAAKEAAGFSPNADAHAAPPPEPKHARTFTATTKTIIRRAMKYKCCRLLAIFGAAGEWGARSIMVGGVLGFLGDGLAAHVDRSIGSF
ncbi:hypothetical protein CDEST_15487 [Colletotrichum destructivum]|uniref:Uncharacterized protein n=1 Tax=Colletotrichum destructivum TaxID=34406 RepID=A0AAX4J517_9PEZI|nr:hypothetical protein CDEST_15487 [Colletotrichum destructivum]